MRAGPLGGTGARTFTSGTVPDKAATVDPISFMDWFRASGSAIRRGGESMVNVIAAARISRWPVPACNAHRLNRSSNPAFGQASHELLHLLGHDRTT